MALIEQPESVHTRPGHSNVASATRPARRGRIGAVIVTYFPHPEALRPAIEAVCKQADFLALVDNTPRDGRESPLSNLFSVPDGRVDITELDVNAGLAAAQNIGIDRLRQFGCDFVLLLDQDSLPAPFMVDALFDAWKALVDDGRRVGAVGPRWVDPLTGSQSPFVRLGIGRLLPVDADGPGATARCDALISSGCLIPMPVIDDVGAMDAALFIDHVDNEWGIRAQRQGYSLHGAARAQLEHGIGERRKRIWIGRWRHIPVHTPIREYYKMRNMLSVYFVRPAPWRWRAYCLGTVSGLMLATTLLLPHRLDRIRMMVRGLRDALVGQLGPYRANYADDPRIHAEAVQPTTSSSRRHAGSRLRQSVGRMWRRLTRSRAAAWERIRVEVEGRSGLEIGGPSPIFAREGALPIYASARRVDNCNFSPETLWEEGAVIDAPFVFDKRQPAGRQRVAEATDLGAITSGPYDFLLSSHTLEHCANPLKALGEWRRVLRPGGALVLVLPHKDATFDRFRPVTTLSHIEQDFDSDVAEDDHTHLAEILELHDLSRDPWAGGRPQFEERSRHNVRNRGLHHHVFDSLLAARVVDRAGFQIEVIEPRKPMDIVIVARKPASDRTDNTAFLDVGAQYLRSSPFSSDRGHAPDSA
jgi:L-rhamnosyltransferase